MRELLCGDYKVRRESWDSQRDAGRYNPASVIIYVDKPRGKRFGCRYRWVIPAGDGDGVYYYRDGREVLCLSVRRSLGYIGLCVWSMDSDDDTPVGEVFLQNADDELPAIIESLRGTRRVKSDVFDYSPAYLTRVLLDWIGDTSW